MGFLCHAQSFSSLVYTKTEQTNIMYIHEQKIFVNSFIFMIYRYVNLDMSDSHNHLSLQMPRTMAKVIKKIMHAQPHMVNIIGTKSHRNPTNGLGGTA